MVKLWNGEETQWKLTLCLDGKEGKLEAGEKPRQLLVCLGEKPETEAVRRSAAKAVLQVKSLGGRSVLMDAAPVVKVLGAEGLAALVQGSELALYRQENWKKEQSEENHPQLYLTGTEGTGEILAETIALDRWICFARDLVNRPGNKLTPIMLA